MQRVATTVAHGPRQLVPPARRDVRVRAVTLHHLVAVRLPPNLLPRRTSDVRALEVANHPAPHVLGAVLVPDVAIVRDVAPLSTHLPSEQERASRNGEAETQLSILF